MELQTPKLQTAVFIPPVHMSGGEVVQEINKLLPESVYTHLESCIVNGYLFCTVSSDGNIHTIDNKWVDEASLQRYKELMADVSPIVKSQLAGDGWNITITPETADL